MRRDFYIIFCACNATLHATWLYDGAFEIKGKRAGISLDNPLFSRLNVLSSNEINCKNAEKRSQAVIQCGITYFVRFNIRIKLTK